MLAGLMLSGCSHYYYLPSSPNIPLLTQQGDWRASIAGYQGGSGSTIPGFELQGSYAISNKIGLITNLLTVSKTEGSEYGKGSYFDLGAGYYKASKSGHFVYEIYGVLGVGHAENGFANLGSSRANFSKIYIQPIIGYKSKYFDAGFTWKLASQRFSAVQYTGTLDSFELDRLTNMQSNPDSFLSEPGFVVRVGIKNIKAQFQYGISINSNRQTLAGVGIGIIVTIPGGQREK